MIKPYVECINVCTGKNDIFILSLNPASIDYMKNIVNLSDSLRQTRCMPI